jgi:4-hydroxybenzoate polyprenyltransferase
MPRPDPIPSPRLSMMRRFWRIMRWMALVAILVAALAVTLIARGDEGFHLHMLIATALGVGLTVLLGTALMTLTFLSASSGHDDEATPKTSEDGE